MSETDFDENVYHFPGTERALTPVEGGDTPDSRLVDSPEVVAARRDTVAAYTGESVAASVVSIPGEQPDFPNNNQEGLSTDKLRHAYVKRASDLIRVFRDDERRAA